MLFAWSSPTRVPVISGVDPEDIPEAEEELFSRVKNNEARGPQASPCPSPK